MGESDLRVSIVKYPDRRHWMMRYIDPVTGKQKARSTGTTNRREADRAASKWQAELQEGRYQTPTKISWDEFRERYESEKVSSLADNTAVAVTSAFNHLERLMAPQKLASVTTSMLSRFQARLREEGIRDTTIATHLRHLKAAFSWAVTVELLTEAPRVQIPKRSKGLSLMRGRPITDLEFAKLLQQVPTVRPKDTALWERYLRGLWLSGLRLEESVILSWEEEAPFSVDLSGRRPRFRIYAEAEKGHCDRLLPMTPDFAQFLLQTPDQERHGHVFKLPGLFSGQQMTSARVGRVISELGLKAEIVVNKAEGRTATAHDLRRSFGTRWASQVMPATLQLLMRHQSIETTMRYYVGQNADDVADELWLRYEERLDTAS